MAAQSVDLVCEGGGVKGIGLAGAYSLLEERGYVANDVAGTSAGAITAALIAAGCKAAELKTIVTSRAFVEKARLDNLIAALSAKVSIVYLEDIRASISLIDKLRELGFEVKPDPVEHDLCDATLLLESP